MAIRRSLELEELGQRILPSVTPLSLPIFPGAPALFGTPHQHHQQGLSGKGQGTYTGNVSIPDTGVSYALTGTADFARLGNVTVDGSVHGVGFIASGHATGTLTFTNKNGSVTLDLQGPTQKGFSSLPRDWQYKVTSATGAYQNLKGQQGALQMTFTADNTATSPQGTFTLKV